jgi:dTDP-4-dehydrorhamnose reductase
MVEASVTVSAVVKAERKLRQLIHYSNNTPLIILGARGFIGTQITKEYTNRKVYAIDLDNKDDFPLHLKGQKVILINLTSKSALREYINKFWKELVLLNEAYPDVQAGRC